jgi:hypothetical protein
MLEQSKYLFNLAEGKCTFAPNISKESRIVVFNNHIK